VWPAPDPALAAASAQGEIAVARGRVWLTLMVLAIPLAALGSGWTREAAVGVGFAAFAVLLALVVDRIAVRRRRVPGLAFMTSIADVTLVSLLQVAYLLIGMPAIAANSRTTYAVYLIAIAATAMRWDVRVCVTAGAVATIQYALIAVIAWRMWAPNPTPETPLYGTIVPGHQVARLVILVAATWVAAAVVHQSAWLRDRATRDG
jgi:hypothetical protein